MDQATGYVKAIVGGRGTEEASLTLNRATATTRQPGSTFKIITTYAPALDYDNMTLSSVYYNAPYTSGTESPSTTGTATTPTPATPRSARPSRTPSTSWPSNA